jgi:hypothetical protein
MIEREELPSGDRRCVSGALPEVRIRTCTMCGCRLSALMRGPLCENCKTITEMNQNGALARNGLMTTDLM